MTNEPGRILAFAEAGPGFRDQGPQASGEMD
jgi:hypothetical protein